MSRNLLGRGPTLEEVGNMAAFLASDLAGATTGTTVSLTAGMVKVKANGRLEVQSCTLSDEAVRAGDKELLEDLIKAAVNQALEKARQLMLEETNKTMSALGLPAGINLPGLG